MAPEERRERGNAMRKTFRRRSDAQTRANNAVTEHSAMLDAEPGVQATRQALGTYVTDVDGLFALRSDRRRNGTRLRSNSGRAGSRFETPRRPWPRSVHSSIPTMKS